MNINFTKITIMLNKSGGPLSHPLPNLSELGSSKSARKCTNAQFDKLEIAIMTNVWGSILTRFNATTKTLQTHGITLYNAERLSGSLCSYVASQRELCEKYENGASDIEGVTRLYEEETKSRFLTFGFKCFAF